MRHALLECKLVGFASLLLHEELFLEVAELLAKFLCILLQLCLGHALQIGP